MARLSTAAQKQLADFKAVTVKHPRLMEVDERISRAIEEKGDAAHVLIYGPSGVGKTLMINHITERFNTEEQSPGHVSIVKIEARPSDTGAYVRLDYYRQVLAALKEQVAVRELLMNVNLSTKPTRSSKNGYDWLDIREAVEQALCSVHVKAVIIDEAEHIMTTDVTSKPIDQLNWLKSLTNHTNVLHILAGPYALADFRNLEPQAARRGRDIHFPRYHIDDPTERLEFVGALRYLLEHIPFQCNIASLLEQWRWFGEMSLGCVGLLKGWLLETVRSTLAEEGTTLTIEMLQANVLDPSQRISIEMDTRTGEHKLAIALAESKKQEQELWGTSPNVPETSDAVPTIPVKKKNQRPGRKPKRDPVGNDD
jgi:DNA polymerase III delta prime subunit